MLKTSSARRIFGLIVLGLGACGSTIFAQTPGTFTATGNMTTSRSSPTATLLADGRVLIAGGDIIDAPTFATQSSAELYDPRSGTFRATGNMTTPRSEHTATLLPDGRVLITGGGVTGARGVSGATSFASAELYDPGTGTFSATGDMTTARVGSTATLLNNGKVLIAGGFQRDPATLNVLLLASAELYDSSTGTFTATGDMTAEWADTATLLPNGRVLITRGNPEGPPPFLSSADLYDPSTGTFTFAGYTIVNHTGPIATLLMNGQVLVAGGDIADGEGGTWIAELYDPTTGAFSSTGNMTEGRDRATATLLPDGTVLIANDDGGTSAELYNFVTGSFSRTGSMTMPVYSNTATLLNDGRVLIAGAEDPQTIPSAEIYTPSVLVPAPMLLSLSGDGQGQGAIQHAGTARIVSADDPAVPGEYLSIYLTGLADGSVIPPQVAIGGRLAEITFFGNVPGYPGENVINVQMPTGVAPGPTVPVRLTYIGRSSNQVTIGVTEVGLQQAVASMKAATGTDSLNFWQWAWFWQNLPPFSGAPAGFGVGGSISPDMMAQIISAGGGDASQNISAEQWIFYYLSSTTAVHGVVNAASHLAGAIAPGELIVVTGSGLGPAQVVSATPDSDGVYAAQLAGTAVLVNGTPAPLVYTSTSQVEAVVPDSVAGGTAQVTVTYQGLTSASFPVPVAPTAPGIFTQDGTGQGHAVTINQAGATNVPAHWEGDVMTLFLTGTGHATPPVAIYGGQQLPITPGPVPGVMQIKVPISHGTDCDLPVVFQVGNATTQPGVTIAVDICI